MPFLQSVGISSCLLVCCPAIPFFARPLFLFPETYSLSDFAQMGCVVASSSGQTTSEFCFPGKFQRIVSTGFTSASFLMSSFLMWSNLSSLAHLTILISAEFSLLPSFIFTAQHCEPYVIAGLMIVLKIVYFYSSGIFLSHITRLLRSTSSTRFLSYC